MSATKILWGQIIIVFLVVLITTWAATQYDGLAARLSGRSSGALVQARWACRSIYRRPSSVVVLYDAYAPEIFNEGAFIAASGGFISIAVAIGMSVWRAREAKNVETYGSARWAEKREVRAAGLLGPDGVVLGKLERDYLRHDGPEHVLCFAPTRSRQGRRPGRALAADLAGLGHRPRHQGRELAAHRRLPRASTAGSCCSIRPIRSRQPTIRCSRSAAANGRSATSRTSPTCWSIRKARSTSATTGRRPATRCWSAPSCMSSTPRRTRRSPASPPSSPIRSGRSSRR